MLKIVTLSLLTLGAVEVLAQEPRPPKDVPTLTFERSIALLDVDGRIDHLAPDVRRNHLLIAALGNDTLEVVDLATGVRTRSIGGLREPQGVAFITKHDRLVVSNGGDGGCNVYDADQLKLVQRVELGPDADNVRYDESRDLVWVAHGDGSLSAFDVMNGTVSGSVRCAGHVESFQLERTGSRLFANVPDANHVAVIDREQAKILDIWPLATARANFPMALDEAHGRLFIGCRSPARLLVLDTGSGKLVADVALSGDVDDVFLDEKRERLYAICGEGFVDVFDVSGTLPERSARVPTRAGARTGLWSESQSRLYVAVPRHEQSQAELRIFLSE